MNTIDPSGDIDAKFPCEYDETNSFNLHNSTRIYWDPLRRVCEE